MSSSGRTARPVADLVVAAVVAAGYALAASAPAWVSGVAWIRVPLGIAVLLVVPGYALGTALYPRARSDADRFRVPGPDEREARALAWDDRLTFSVVASLALVALSAAALIASPWGLQAAPLAGALGSITIVSVLVSGYRRRTVAPDECPDAARAADSAVGGVYSEVGSGARRRYAFALLVVAGLVVAAGGSAYAAHDRPEAEGYSELAILTENETGQPTASEYPSNLTAAESAPLRVYVENHRRTRTNYTVVVSLERLSAADDRTVTASTELDRLHVPLADGESQVVDHTVTPEMTGDDLRLTYLLYDGEVPAQPAQGNADLSAHLAVNVSAPPGENRTASDA